MRVGCSYIARVNITCESKWISEIWNESCKPWITQALLSTINVRKRHFKKCRICGNYILLSREFLFLFFIVCNPNACLPIQMQDSAKDNVTSDNIYSPPPAPHTHTRKARASVHVVMQMWLWWEEKGDDGRDWVGNNIQGGGRKFLGHLIRHCWSRI